MRQLRRSQSFANMTRAICSLVLLSLARLSNVLSVFCVPRCWQMTKPCNACKLKRHLDTKHPDLKEKPVDFFKRKRDGLQQQKNTIPKHSTVSKQCLEASYVVAHRIAKLGKPHTIAETLILPAAQDMCRIMTGAKLSAI